MMSTELKKDFLANITSNFDLSVTFFEKKVTKKAFNQLRGKAIKEELTF